MAVTKLSNSGIKTGVLKYDSMLAGNPPYSPAAYDSIVTISPSGSSSFSFTSIPSSYKHLEIRYVCFATGGNSLGLQLNNDTNANYRFHGLEASGTNVFVGGGNLSGVGYFLGAINNGTVASQPNVGIISILDYASTTKNKVVRNFVGGDRNVTSGANYIAIGSNFWNNTAAISTITIVCSANFSANSRFSLFGIKG